MQLIANRYLRTNCKIAGDILCTLSPDGFVNSIRPSLSQITGFDEGELVGKSFATFIHSDESQRVKASLLQVNGETEVLQNIHCNSKSGKFCSLDLSFVPQFNKGEVIEVLCIGTDRTSELAPPEVKTH